jgi:hypothetical protein
MRHQMGCANALESLLKAELNQKSFASFLQKRRTFFLERKKQRTFIIAAWPIG